MLNAVTKATGRERFGKIHAALATMAPISAAMSKGRARCEKDFLGTTTGLREDSFSDV